MTQYTTISYPSGVRNENEYRLMCWADDLAEEYRDFEVARRGGWLALSQEEHAEIFEECQRRAYTYYGALPLLRRING